METSPDRPQPATGDPGSAQTPAAPRAAAPGPAAAAGPPRAAERPVDLDAQGERRRDPWYWLRDREDPLVLAHLRAENAYTEAATAHLTTLRAELFDEIRSRIVETDLSVPVRDGRWWYYQRTEEGRDYPIHCRVPVDAPGVEPDVPPGLLPPHPGVDDSQAHAPAPVPGEEVLLDENAVAAGHAYLHVSDVSVSPGGNLLAYAADTTGDERFTLRIRDLARGTDLDETIPDTSYSVAWAGDTTLFYTRADRANRPFQLWRHHVGQDPAGDVLVHEEGDERFFVGVGTTKDRSHVVAHLQSQITSEVHTLRADRPDGAFSVVAARRDGIEYGLDHHSGRFLILTNDEAEDFRLMAAPTADPRRDTWREVLPHRRGVRLLGVDVFARHLALYERLDGDLRIRVHPLHGPDPLSSPLPPGRLVAVAETPSACWGGPNPEFDSATLRFDYSSLVTPRSVYDLPLDTGGDTDDTIDTDGGLRAAVLRKRQPVLGGYDPSDYVTARLWADSADGTAVPISIVHRGDVEADGTAPCLLYGYGAYEHSIDPVFSSIRLSLLDRGFVYAIAHVRGGGELGRRWYEDGKMLAKHHTFEDYAACAQALVSTGWADPIRLVARGASAGGMLMGATANTAGDLFAAMVAEVPFVDCLTTMLDPSLPLTVTEWEEWGNPGADPAVYAAMRAYSPYDNVRRGRYPDLLVTAGLEDPRVGYWEPAKWVQKIRAASPGSRVLLKVDLDAGHGGPSGRYDAWRDEAFVVAFILDETGLAGASCDAGAGTDPTVHPPLAR